MACDSCEIKNLVYRYADQIDRGDLQGVASLLAGAALVTVDGNGVETELRGERDILGLYRAFTRLYEDDGTPRTLHMTGNVTVEVQKDGETARAQSVAVVFQALEGFPLQPIITVRYDDRFTRGDEGWRFSRRRIETRLTGDLSHHLLQSI
jgi:hypothetical protein